MIRADASLTIGHGHVMRCLTLASSLRAGGATVGFVCREHADHLCDLIEARGFAVSRLPAGGATQAPNGDGPVHASWLGAAWQEDAAGTRAAIDAAGGKPDWLVADHYAIDHRWEGALRTSARHIMAIDDLADRKHVCDLLLDQNYFPNAADRYEGLVPPYCQRLYGPEYVLLRDEFRRARAAVGTARERRLLLFFGGGDPTGQTEAALDAVLSFDASLALDVVVGGGNARADAIERRCRALPGARFMRQTDDMAGVMAGAALCLGAGGITTFERIFMELPSIVVATADNQREALEALARL